MGVLPKYLSFVFLSLSLICPSASAQDVCETKSPCICVFPNGTGIDLSPSAKTEFYSARNFRLEENGKTYELATYYYHPCTDIKINTTESHNETLSTCNGPLAICRYVTKMTAQDVAKGTFQKDMGVYDWLGNSSLSTFGSNTQNGLYINYTHLPSWTLVKLMCAETPDMLHIDSLDEPARIVLSFYSKNACLKQIESPGRSVGSTLCIIFFSILILYLVLGVCTKKFLMGATGVEVVPNLAFWTDLPNLVRDGWLFMVSGFKLPARSGAPAASPDPNSYDSI